MAPGAMVHCARRATYEPRQTAASDLARIVTAHAPAFIAALDEAGTPLPDFVTREFEAFGRCGDLRHGFLRTSCQRCAHEHLVPLSCKGRGFCPSCMGRRMAETSSLLTDHLLPEVDYRHFTVTFAGPLATRLAFDRALLSSVLGAVGRRLEQSLRRRVKKAHDLASVSSLHTGSVTVVQRFRFDLGLYLHLHSLWTDGAFDERQGDVPQWWPAPPCSPGDLQAVVAGLDADLDRLLQTGEDELMDLEGIGACLQLGRPLSSVAPSTMAPAGAPLLAKGRHVCLHAASSFDGRDRKRLQRQLSYMLRPPVALDHVRAQPDGSVRLIFKQPTARGSTFVDLQPFAFLARLAALVPPPGFHTVRYRGVFASRHHLRPVIAYRDPDAAPVVVQLPLFEKRGPLDLPARPDADAAPTPRRIAWAKLLARTFSIDVTVCPKCSGPMKVVQPVLTPEAIAQVLARHGHLPRGPPPPLPLPNDPQLNLVGIA